MKYKKQDKRVNKSKNAITNALLKLMEEKPVNDITVSELTTVAGINRKTFYNHYDSIDSVLSELENNCSNWVLSFVREQPVDILINRPTVFYTGIAKGLLRHKDLLRLLHDSGVYSRMSDKISTSMKETILEKTEREFKPEFLPTARLILDFVTAGAVGVYDSMFESGKSVSIDEVAATFEWMFEKSNLRELLSEGMIG